MNAFSIIERATTLAAKAQPGWRPRLNVAAPRRLALAGGLAGLTVFLAACGGGPTQKHNSEFFTSGSREADQRASQRMAKAEQLADTGSDQEQGKVKKAKPAAGSATAPGGSAQAVQAEKKVTLFMRLGGEVGISNIVADFTARALQDPRVNWRREGIKQGGFSFHAKRPMTWNASPDDVAKLKLHLVQFLNLATGGPAHYEGKEIKTAHAGQHITNAEFEATMGDLKATLDKLQIPDKEQKELLAVVESTRPEIVEER